MVDEGIRISSGEATDHEHGRGSHSHDQHHELQKVPLDDHDHHDQHHDGEPASSLEHNPIWQQDNVFLTSIGIDVGSAGTQVLFSRLHLRRIGENLSSRYVVVKRESIFQSPVKLTPFSDRLEIDAAALGSIIDTAYEAAGMTPEAVDTGVVILTGEALRRTNAERIAEILSERGGDFVTASAGHHMEAQLAAYGSGAARMSYDQGIRILNIDIGGGTTKLAVLEGGRVVATAALHVGGRLFAMDESGSLRRIEPAGALHARRAGHELSLGDRLTPEVLDRMAGSMAASLVEATFVRPLTQASSDLYLTEPIDDLGRIDGILFSGGVSEYIYGQEHRDFGDIGRRLGAAIRGLIDRKFIPHPVLPMGERIRATALGAAEYSVQLSGNTGYISDAEALLPRRNLKVVRPILHLSESIDREEVGRSIRTHLRSFDAENSDSDVVVSLAWSGSPDYLRVSALAEGVVLGLAERVTRSAPVYLMVDGDLALTLGRILRDEFEVDGPLLVLDGLRLADFDFVDIGRVRHPSKTVPVTVKSLVFGAASETGSVSVSE